VKASDGNVVIIRVSLMTLVYLRLAPNSRPHASGRNSKTICIPLLYSTPYSKQFRSNENNNNFPKQDTHLVYDPTITPITYSFNRNYITMSRQVQHLLMAIIDPEVSTFSMQSWSGIRINGCTSCRQLSTKATRTRPMHGHSSFCSKVKD
jgi:hypothetical protein